MKRRAHFIVEGLVQGVCYRMTACEEAVRLGLTGWVRNLAEGDVEIMAEGDDKALGAFLNWCRRGPRYARVSQVNEEYSEPTGEFNGFEIE